MRLAPFVVLSLAGIAQAQQAKFDVLVKGKKAGVATYAVSPYKGSGRLTRLRIVLADGSISESVSKTDATGAAVGSENSVRRGATGSKEVVTYDGRGDATIVRDKGKGVVVPFDRRGSRKDPSETWFRSVKPKPGTWAVFRALDPRKRVWEEVKVSYVGKRGAGNVVRQQRGGLMTVFTLDDAGIPLVIESGDLRMVRR
ncbi:hypothetical protein EON82_04770 [bacterium]|nr:MAG: hypothetical protein EON82_04770 [bacterium]